MSGSPTSPAVVVGVDGSKVAIRTALWAADEAVDRNVPLRLLCAVDQDNTKPVDERDTPRLANAEMAVHWASAAVEATDKPVKIEAEISRDSPISALVSASRSAAMVCVGALGLNHFQPGRVGSTAAALAVAAHCPVAIVRGGGHRPQPSCQWIVVEADESPDVGVVLEAAATEARLRNAPLRAVTCWKSSPADQPAAGDCRIRARLDRRMARWRRRYPDLSTEAIALHGCLLDYLAKHAASVQLLVVGARHPDHVREILGAAGNAALVDFNGVLLVVGHQHL
ncbi:universal stress protein [Mycobacterium noviomagense]|uniref:Universal stress protein n=1 Tax=Mycobacterium noviomagense TaxID=459858 RepID=A0A7I7PI18_9MYCO|nr:universal stress protein [Mycobacterium noviomagense]ORB11220.1 hypothetical protein BST37_20380 [Mycobacterium noviomagense]BBY08226.1 universal stress protein [Mycobacterium noviomagense]